MVAMTSSTSLTFLKDEIDSTLADAARLLESWAADPAKKVELENCAELITQLHGIFQVLELPAATLMVAEMSASLEQMLQDTRSIAVGSALSQALVLLGRYLEYVQLKNRPMPEVMISGINELRRAAGKALIQESHFFAVDLARQREPQPAAGSHQDISRLGRRLRHMYQIGLLGVIREQNPGVSLKLMSRALARIDRLCGPVPMGRLWWVARAAVDAMIADGMAMTPARKALLSQVDRQIKRLVQEGERALNSDVPLLLLKEGIFVVSLSRGATALVGEVKQVFGLRERISDAELQQEIALMAGGSGSVARSVAESLKTELNQIKQTLDLAAQGVADTDYREVAAMLERVSGTLVMVNLHREAQSLKERALLVAQWQANKDVDSGDFQALVDDMLDTENALAALERSLLPPDDAHKAVGNHKISLYQLDDARTTVVSECRSGLSMMKRALASYLESGGDRMHLANLPGVLSSISGGLMFLDLPRARAASDACRSYVEQKLLASSAVPELEAMETLADAVTSVDYYLESMEEQKPIGDAILEVAEQSMEALGYPVIRPVS